MTTRRREAVRMKGAFLLAACLLLPACSDKPEPTPSAPDVEHDDWCDRVAPGPTGSVQGALAMSSAHALVRFFGAGSGYDTVDAALARSLEGDTVDWDAAAGSYAEALGGVCALPVSAARELPPVRVEQAGSVALIHPGPGDVVLPPGTQAVAIDLRELPEVPELKPALERALAAASAQPVARVPERARLHRGMTDESGGSEYYSNTITVGKPPPYAAAGPADLPLALLTGPTLAPSAARFAVDLRVARRAWLFGESVFTSVAEARWVPVGAKGLAVRTGQLVDGQGTVPDVLRADRPLSGTGADSLGVLPGLGTPPEVDRSTPAQRVFNPPRKATGVTTLAVAQSPGIARADLVIAHGATRRFFPYFSVVGDGIDARLLETLAAVDARPVDRQRLFRLLARFGEVLHDGHNVVTGAESPTVGIAPIVWDEVAGEAVVRRSAVPGVNPGDTLVSVGGTPAADWFSEVLARTSAATPGYRFVVATWRLVELTGPVVLGLRGRDGAVRSVEVQPQAKDSLVKLGTAASHRAAGTLEDLGAPSLYYINLSNEVLTDLGRFSEELDKARSTRGLVLDMRGYPGTNPYEVARHFFGSDVPTPVFRRPVWPGPQERVVDETQGSYTSNPTPLFDGPVVLLVAPQTISAAETLSTLMVQQRRARVVGRRTAGTNGNITELVLPGSVRFMFSGVEVLFPDHSTYHGVGIVPDVEAAPTVEDLATGRDTELLKAVELLQAGG